MAFEPLALTFVVASQQSAARNSGADRGLCHPDSGLAVLLSTLSIVSTPKMPLLALVLTIFGQGLAMPPLSSAVSSRSKPVSRDRHAARSNGVFACGIVTAVAFLSWMRRAIALG